MPIHLKSLHEFSVLTLDRPAALNALDAAIMAEFTAALQAVRHADSRALIITGGGTKAFCVGADLKEIRAVTAEAQRATIQSVQAAFDQLEQLPIPSIAAIDGYAFGGGLELALACTFRVATPRSVMALPEITLGLIPGYGGTQRLPWLIGHGRALELIMSGRQMDAAEALSTGLINRMAFGDVMQEAITFARTFAGHSRAALALAREAVHCAADTSLEEGLSIERDLIGRALQSDDGKEGMAAFVEKRKPVFHDR
jgi:enoyl-CoA hydratase